MAYEMTEERRAELVRLSEQIGVPFHRLSLLDEALTHSSYTNESKNCMPHNERLEFLGDAVLELASSTYLYERFPDCSEGELTKMRASLVQSETLARLARGLELGSHLLLGRGELLGGGADRQNNLENAFEAVIGAVYLDGGWETARDYVARQFATEVLSVKRSHVSRDYKTTLQEHIQQKRHESISYELIGESGPDHDKRFTTRVLIGGESMGEGTGRSKKEAEQQAAAEALSHLKRR
ncbi:ribonuclease III [Selenomonas sp. oral taxon 892 str. F0426]|uniref:ribonuclease III n=1 Tax=Selenomonas sp. oral taxon 892 TaxID=1321785 RepID=UPI0003AD1B82|nr:ribonuclease III [Selenomonas sp. oral taxon 892]ERJ89323.1 ribonuclease III [Selenomonas sp. oral taxon 892 str. F0426]